MGKKYVDAPTSNGEPNPQPRAGRSFLDLAMTTPVLALGALETFRAPVIMLVTALLLVAHVVAWERRTQRRYLPFRLWRVLRISIALWLVIAAGAYATDIGIEYDAFAQRTLPVVQPWALPDFSGSDNMAGQLFEHGLLCSIAVVVLLHRRATSIRRLEHREFSLARSE